MLVYSDRLMAPEHTCLTSSRYELKSMAGEYVSYSNVHHYTWKDCLLAFSRILMLILHILPSCTTLLNQHTLTELVPVLAQSVVVLRNQEYHMTCVRFQ